MCVYMYVCMCMHMCVTYSVTSDSLQPHEPQPASLFCPWNSPKQEYWSGQLFPSPGDFHNPGIEPMSPALQADSLPSEPPHQVSPKEVYCGGEGEGIILEKRSRKKMGRILLYGLLYFLTALMILVTYHNTTPLLNFTHYLFTALSCANITTV